MVAFILRVALMEGQCQGQIGSNWVKFSNSKYFLQKLANRVQLCLKIPKKCYSFLCTTVINTKQNAVQNSEITIFTFFNCTAKNKDIGLKFGMLIVCMESYNMYSVFL